LPGITKIKTQGLVAKALRKKSRRRINKYLTSTEDQGITRRQGLSQQDEDPASSVPASFR
jgi:hypothetical protein